MHSEWPVQRHGDQPEGDDGSVFAGRVQPDLDQMSAAGNDSVFPGVRIRQGFR